MRNLIAKELIRIKQRNIRRLKREMIEAEKKNDTVTMNRIAEDLMYWENATINGKE